MLPISAPAISPQTAPLSPIAPLAPLTPNQSMTSSRISVKLDPTGNPILMDASGAEVRGLVSRRGDKWIWTTADGRQGESKAT